MMPRFFPLISHFVRNPVAPVFRAWSKFRYQRLKVFFGFMMLACELLHHVGVLFRFFGYNELVSRNRIKEKHLEEFEGYVFVPI